jgi:hypothetical protein
MLGHSQAQLLCSVAAIEQAKVDPGRVFGKEREIDAVSGERRAERIRGAQPYLERSHLDVC